MGWIIFSIIVALVIDIIFAIKFGKAAEEKGYSKGAYFWCCFLFGAAGYILVAALPDKNARNNQITIMTNQKTILAELRRQQSHQPVAYSENNTQQKQASKPEETGTQQKQESKTETPAVTYANQKSAFTVEQVRNEAAKSRRKEAQVQSTNPVDRMREAAQRVKNTKPEE